MAYVARMQHRRILFLAITRTSMLIGGRRRESSRARWRIKMMVACWIHALYAMNALRAPSPPPAPQTDGRCCFWPREVSDCGSCEDVRFRVCDSCSLQACSHWSRHSSLARTPTLVRSQWGQSGNVCHKDEAHCLTCGRPAGIYRYCSFKPRAPPAPPRPHHSLSPPPPTRSPPPPPLRHGAAQQAYGTVQQAWDLLKDSDDSATDAAAPHANGEPHLHQSLSLALALTRNPSPDPQP